MLQTTRLKTGALTFFPKQRGRLFLSCLVLLIAFSSCHFSVTKRRYTSGFYVDAGFNHRSALVEKKSCVDYTNDKFSTEQLRNNFVASVSLLSQPVSVIKLNSVHQPSHVKAKKEIRFEMQPET